MDNNYYDDYDNFADEDFEYISDYTKSTGSWTIDLIESLEACITPTLLQIGSYLAVLLGTTIICQIICCLLRRLPTSSRIEKYQHLSALLCGSIMVYFLLGWLILFILCFAILSYTLLFALNSRISIVGLLIGLHFCLELFLQAPEMWQRVRGFQIVAMMKTISLCCDLQQDVTNKQSTKIKSLPNLLAYLAYIFFPANCILGPWISYADYLCILRTAKLKLHQIFKSIFNVVLALSFLILSNCLVPVLGDHQYVANWKWLSAYRDALSVRCSHYFICFLSQASFVLAVPALRDSNVLLGTLVARPWEIEWPRSLPAVVRAWNLPMHNWLKTYIFKPWQMKHKYVLTVLGTYLVSALLHGLHIRIYLVLISLAVFGYIEMKLRAKLASIFGACIAVNPCRRELCNYEYCLTKLSIRNLSYWLVLFVNFLFSLLNIFHLAYLGILMESSSASDSFTDIRDVCLKYHSK